LLAFTDKTALNLVSKTENLKLTNDEIKEKTKSEIENARKRFSKEQIQEYHQIFRNFDMNGDGCLSIDEISKIFEKLDIKISEKKMKLLFDKIDTDQNNFVDFEEFLGLISGFYNDISPEIELKEAFDLFDIDSDMFITYQDLQEYLKANNIDTQENQDIIKDIMIFTDLNGDFKIDFNEFSMMYKITKDVMKQLKQIDLIRSSAQKKLENNANDMP
jgi:Ca2+-binding EF-hand superfamily protein